MLYAAGYVTDGGDCRSRYVSFGKRYGICPLQESRSKRLHGISVAWRKRVWRTGMKMIFCLGRIDTQLSTKD